MALSVRQARLIPSPVVAALVACLLLSLLLAGLLWAGGFDVSRAVAAALRGSFGSLDAILSATLVRATPLLFCGLAVSIAFRAGVLNIGADGQLLAGAVAATALLSTSPSLVPLAIVVAAIAGGLTSGIAGVMRARFGVLEVVSTIMLNFLLLYLVGYLVRGPLQEPTGVFPQTETLSVESRLPLLVPGSRLHLGFIIGGLCAVGLWWHQRFTASGFRLRVVGVNPHAAATAGRVDVGRVRMRAFVISGAIAGIAGGAEVMGVTYALYENLSPGYGYTAIAVALLAGLHPLGVIASAVVFGAMAAGGAAMQREAGVPSVIVSVLEAGVILAVVAARASWAKRGIVPASAP